MTAVPRAAAVVSGALSGVLSSDELQQTARFIASQQAADGGLPWFVGGHLDPWDHVESAMALSVAGLEQQAERAYRYCADSQREDGSWPMVVRDGVVEEAAADTNQVAYVAVGVWQHHLLTRDTGFLRRMWPTVRRALDFVLSAQRPDGVLAWAVDADGVPDAATSLVTGSSSAAQALRCGSLAAQALGLRAPHWEDAAARLAHALRAHPDVYADRSRYSMDWYYPVLSGVLRGEAARRRIAAGWNAFVLPGHGVRCVGDRPWVTAAESSELVLALDAIGERARALRVLADIQHLRDEDGAYWTGFVVDDDAVWPVERTTWTAAAVVLAADALARRSAASGLFRDAALPSDGGVFACCSFDLGLEDDDDLLAEELG